MKGNTERWTDCQIHKMTDAKKQTDKQINEWKDLLTDRQNARQTK